MNSMIGENEENPLHRRGWRGTEMHKVGSHSLRHIPRLMCKGANNTHTRTMRGQNDFPTYLGWVLSIPWRNTNTESRPFRREASLGGVKTLRTAWVLQLLNRGG